MISKIINIFRLPNRLNRIRCMAMLGFYWYLVLSMGIILSFSQKGTITDHILKTSMMLPALICIVMVFLLYIKRLHDFNCSGWFSLLLFIPLIGGCWGLLISIIPGTKGNNRFGPMPDKASKLEYLIAFLWIPAVIMTVVLLSPYLPE